MKTVLMAALIVAGCASQDRGVQLGGRMEYIEAVSEEPIEPDAISAEITAQVRALLSVSLLDRVAVGHELGGLSWSPPAERAMPDFVFTTYRGIVESGNKAFSSVEYAARSPSAPGSISDRAQLILSLHASVCYEGDALMWGAEA